MNLVEQIFEQAKLGTAQDPNANPFAEGMRIGVAQQHADIAKQQLALEIAQAPLKQTLLQQDASLNALKLEQGLKARQDDIDAAAAWTGLANRVSPLLTTGKLDDAIIAHADAGLNNNTLLTYKPYISLGKQLDEMDKEAKLAEYRKGLIDARSKAADVSQFRALPLAQKLEMQARDAEANGDGEMAAYLRSQATLEADKLKVRQAELVARENRTKAIEARTQELSQRLSSLDKIAMASDLRSVDDQPNSKMSYEQKVAAKEAIHEKYAAKAARETAPKGGAGAPPPAPPAANGSERVYVKKGGKTYWIPREDLQRAVQQGYTVDDTYAP